MSLGWHRITLLLYLEVIEQFNNCYSHARWRHRMIAGTDDMVYGLPPRRGTFLLQGLRVLEGIRHLISWCAITFRSCCWSLLPLLFSSRFVCCRLRLGQYGKCTSSRHMILVFPWLVVQYIVYSFCWCNYLWILWYILVLQSVSITATTVDSDDQGNTLKMHVIEFRWDGATPKSVSRLLHALCMGSSFVKVQ